MSGIINSYKFCIGFFGVIVIGTLLQGCPVNKSSSSLGAGGTEPYGEWLLSNPEDLQKDLIAGELLVSRKAIYENNAVICEENGFSLVLFEKNFGYGCADYASLGSLEFNKLDKRWYLVSDIDSDGTVEKLKVEREGNRLHLFQESGKKLLFERSSRKVMDKKNKEACRLSERL